MARDVFLPISTTAFQCVSLDHHELRDV